MSREEKPVKVVVSYRRWSYRLFFPRLHDDMIGVGRWPRFRALLDRLRVRRTARLERNVDFLRKLKLRPRPDAVTQQFLAQSGRTSYLCGFPLLALALGAQLYGGDVVASGTCLCLALVLIAHRVVTEYRVRRGIFGSNFDEAVELIEFILEENDKGRGPPGTRVSLDYQAKEEVIPELGAVRKGA